MFCVLVDTCTTCAGYGSTSIPATEREFLVEAICSPNCCQYNHAQGKITDTWCRISGPSQIAENDDLQKFGKFSNYLFSFLHNLFHSPFPIVYSSFPIIESDRPFYMENGEWAIWFNNGITSTWTLRRRGSEATKAFFVSTSDKKEISPR